MSGEGYKRAHMPEKGSTGGLTSLQKAWEVLFPYLLYYLAYNAAYLILVFAYQAALGRFGEPYVQFTAAYEGTVSGVMGGLCMAAGVLPLLPMLKRELRGRGETFFLAGRKGTEKAEDGADGTGEMTMTVKRRPWATETVLTALLAFSASLGLNALLALTGFAGSSSSYKQVADRQYSVVFAVGLVLYGVISPLTEEVLFRGVIYNRLRRLYNPALGIVLSGVLFGSFHGNPVQGVYGACLGMLMAYLYERSGRFTVSVLFHAVANLAVYITARMEGVQSILLSPVGCVILLAVSAGCVLRSPHIFQQKERED